MNTLLCSYLSAHTAEDTLFVLWGFSSEDAGLPRPSLDALLQQRLSRYLSSLLQQNPCVITAEEFALHADTLAQEFPHIILEHLLPHAAARVCDAYAGDAVRPSEPL